MEFCGEPHPETGRPCTRPARESHRFHIGGAGEHHVEWENASFVAPPSRASRATDRDALDRGRAAMREIAKAIKPERRSVGVLKNDPRERMDGAQQAMDAIEPEFLAGAIDGGRVLSMAMQRWTADDLWDWLEEHDYNTSHPKAMTGVLRKLQGKEFRFIKGVDKDDPDAFRTPRRSNESRLLRVYESLIYSPMAELVPRNFE